MPKKLEKFWIDQSNLSFFFQNVKGLFFTESIKKVGFQ